MWSSQRRPIEMVNNRRHIRKPTMLWQHHQDKREKPSQGASRECKATVSKHGALEARKHWWEWRREQRNRSSRVTNPWAGGWSVGWWRMVQCMLTGSRGVQQFWKLFGSRLDSCQNVGNIACTWWDALDAWLVWFLGRTPLGLGPKASPLSNCTGRGVLESYKLRRGSIILQYSIFNL